MFPMRVLFLLAVLVTPVPGWAQSASLFSASVDAGERMPLIGPRASDAGVQAGASSLFVGSRRHSFLEPLPDRGVQGPVPAPRSMGGTAAEQLRHLIAEAEAGRAGYDAVNHGARVKPPKPPTQMTVGEVYAWIAATPGQPHAIGRYQFIPPTLRRLVDHLGVSPQNRFSPELQDRLADQLLIEAGFLALQRDEITRRSFMYRLAKIWAGLPLPSGASYYEGYAGNKATMTWARFEGAMAQIFPG